MSSKHTPGPWSFACDSYGKVRHSKLACVYAHVVDDRGSESLPHVASRIDNWDDARLIAAAPELLAVAESIMLRGHATGCASVASVDRPGARKAGCDCLFKTASAAVAKARGES